MRRNTPRIATMTLAIALASGLVCSRPAVAETYEDLAQRIEDTTAAYHEAMQHVEQAQREIDTNEQKIEDIQAKIPAQRARAASSVRTLYKIQQSSGGLVELVLSSEDFNSFVATISYLDRIQDRNFDELEALVSMNAELQQAKDSLKANKALADKELATAQTAQQEALDAREAMRRQAAAQAAAEAEAAAEALRVAAESAAENKTITTASGQEVEVVAPDPDQSPTPTIEQAKPESEPEKKAEEKPQEEPKQEEPAAQPTLDSSEAAFVAEWTSRIDAYLAGSAMSGCGKYYAQAAWDFGVDPRLSPAISCIESGKGAVCFHPHNAWGWGSASWGDWQSAIRGHVSGFARLYGYTITPSGAEMYSGMSNWQEWYSLVLGQMSCI